MFAGVSSGFSNVKHAASGLEPRQQEPRGRGRGVANRGQLPFAPVSGTVPRVYEKLGVAFGSQQPMQEGKQCLIRGAPTPASAGKASWTQAASPRASGLSLAHGWAAGGPVRMLGLRRPVSLGGGPASPAQLSVTLSGSSKVRTGGPTQAGETQLDCAMPVPSGSGERLRVAKLPFAASAHVGGASPAGLS